MLIFKNQLKDIVLDASSTFLIYDRDLLKYSSAFKTWQKKFEVQYAVKGGENLKDLKNFESHMRQILKRSASMNTRHMQFVVVGGGSLGDFGGFVASVFKRGVRLIHIPSTWLAAIDSSHGGKTALNIRSTKNQIGSFYPAEKIYLIEQLLMAQPPDRAIEACGELVKIALIDNGSWVKSLTRGLSTEDALIRNLKSAIQAKYKVIKKDPFEKTGFRQILNLGHTWGHVLESAFGIAHGTAVSLGLHFSIDWSFQKKLLRAKDFIYIQSLLEILDTPKIPKLNSRKALALLLQDKKSDGRRSLSFIFLKSLGKPVRMKVTAHEVLKEAQRQGWIKQ